MPSSARRIIVVTSRLTAALSLAMLTFAACGSSRGSNCESDSACGGGEVCAAQACISSGAQKKCVVPCSSDADCVSKDGAGSKCSGLAECQKYCSKG